MSYPGTLQNEIMEQLAVLGVSPSSILVVHTSFRAVGSVEGGPTGLISALTTVLGPKGTLVMPSMSDDDDTPFDPAATSCLGMGIVADSFWREQGTLRSNSPHAFAARGPAAVEITADHAIDVPHGLDSPVGRVYEREGSVLLLGVGHDANTTIHLAESLARVRYRRPKYVMVREGDAVVRHDYAEIDHCCEHFVLMDDWLRMEGVQREGSVGRAEARLIRSRDVVRVATAKLAEDETVFLHPAGVDHECDEARASLSRV